ncbi:MAG: HNH endonuclease [Acidobacteriales bacterium]|nr:HNH endonuclease [Terriglobales bacterium]
MTASAWKEILDYHDNRCAYCLERVSSPLHRDHVVAVSRGGEDSPENIVPACQRCNVKKYDLPVFYMVAATQPRTGPFSLGSSERFRTKSSKL